MVRETNMKNIINLKKNLMWLLLVNYCRRFCIKAGTKQKWQYDHRMCKIKRKIN